MGHVKSAERIGTPGLSRPRLVKIVTSTVVQRNKILKRAKLLPEKDSFSGVTLTVISASGIGRKTRLRREARISENPGKSVKIINEKLLLEGLEVDREDPLRFILSSL